MCAPHCAWVGQAAHARTHPEPRQPVERARHVEVVEAVLVAEEQAARAEVDAGVGVGEEDVVASRQGRTHACTNARMQTERAYAGTCSIGSLPPALTHTAPRAPVELVQAAAGRQVRGQHAVVHPAVAAWRVGGPLQRLPTHVTPATRRCWCWGGGGGGGAPWPAPAPPAAGAAAAPAPALPDEGEGGGLLQLQRGCLCCAGGGAGRPGRGPALLLLLLLRVLP